MLKKENYGNENDILIAPELAFGLSVIVDNDSVSADSDGKKIIKAGTPLYCAKDPALNRQEVMTSNKSASTVAIYGIARHDIDVTAGNTNATLLMAGYVDYLKLDSTVQGLIDTEKENLPKITFVKGAK